MKLLALTIVLTFISVPAYSHWTVFGDSIFSYHTLLDNLKYDHDIMTVSYAFNGNKVDDITEQYEHFRLEAHTDTILMNAGGNDVLKNKNCYQNNETCAEIISLIGDSVRGLLALMESDGVNKVVFLGYYHTNVWPTSKLSHAVNTGAEMMRTICNESMICKFVDTRSAFDAERNVISWDRVHPNKKGNRILTNLLAPILGDY